jgi:hypothetical protein
MSNTPTHGSDVQEASDWWKASDGRFYPPELHPDYVKSVDPAPPVAAEGPAETQSLAERLPAEADRVGDEASAATDAGLGSMGSARETLDGERSTVDEATASAAAAAAATGKVPDADDPPPTIPAMGLATEGQAQTIIQQPGVPLVSPEAPPSMPPSPGAPPSVPPSMPLSPGAPPSAPAGMPPSPGAPPSVSPSMPPVPTAPAPIVDQGPGGVTYTTPPDLVTSGMPPMQAQASFQPPSAPAPAKASSKVSGLIAVIGGAAAITGSMLNWGKGAVTGANGVEKAVIEVSGFDSNGLITAICGGVLILAGILFFMGVPKQQNWAILAFLGGAVIVGAVVFSMIDIGDLSSRYAAQWQSEGLASVGDVISTQADVGLWITGAGGVLGVLSAPFVNRG